MPVITVGDVTVPNVTGLDLTAAQAAIDAVYLDHSETYSYTGTPGTVLSQSPLGGVDVSPPATVALTVSGIFPLSQRSSIWSWTLADRDFTRPVAPGGFNGQTSSETAILLGWNAATDAAPSTPGQYVSGLVSYELYRNGVLIQSPTGTSFNDTGLTAYTVYTYTIRSVDAAGNKSMFAASIAPRTLDLTPPTTPTITATQTGQTSISVALTVPSTDSGSGV